MRTNIDIDDELMEQAFRASGKTTKKDVVQTALEMLVKIDGQRLIRRSRGKGDFWPEVIADRKKYDIED